jgi:hypothetical protein
MWSHYTNQHRGIVIEFDTEHLPFNTPEYLLPVIYGKEKPLYFYKFAMDGWEKDFIEFATHKFEDWAYESEWRMIVQQSSLDDKRATPISPLAIKSVIFGLKHDMSLKTEVCELFRDPKWKHVRLFDAVPHQTEYRIERKGILMINP